MNMLRPMFLLLGRASVFWIGAIWLFVASMFVAGITTPEARLGLILDPVFVSAVVFPACAGWLAGAVIQEFQHTSFAMVLPSVRLRIATGFLTIGFFVSLIVAGLIGQMSTTHPNVVVLSVVCLGTYCFGGAFLDPLSNWVASFNVAVALLLLGWSREAGRFVDRYPGPVMAVSLGAVVVYSLRVFSRSTFRRKPFRPTSYLPGRFSLEKSRQVERWKIIRQGPTKTGWHAGYLGSEMWNWVRAAFHEVHGAHGWKTVAKALGRLWGMGLLIVLYAWVDRGEFSFGEAIARSLYDALFRSPHQAPFGEKGGPFLVVLIIISAAGVVSALFTPVAFRSGMAYPLSRRQHAQVMYRGGLVDVSIFLFILAPALLAVGHLLGWLVGYEVRFDFMPYFFRALLITLILVPLAHWGRLTLWEATRRRSEHTMLGVIIGVTGFVLAVLALSVVSAGLLRPPAIELAGLSATLLASQLIHRQKLRNYFRTADLA